MKMQRVLSYSYLTDFFVSFRLRQSVKAMADFREMRLIISAVAGNCSLRNSSTLVRHALTMLFWSLGEGRALDGGVGNLNAGFRRAAEMLRKTSEEDPALSLLSTSLCGGEGKGGGAGLQNVRGESSYPKQTCAM